MSRNYWRLQKVDADAQEEIELVGGRNPAGAVTGPRTTRRNKAMAMHLA